MVACTGGPQTSVTPGMPARSSTFQAMPERMIELLIAFSEKLSGQRAFDGAAQDRIVAMGDRGDAHRGPRRALARDIAGEFGERAFHQVGGGVERQETLDTSISPDGRSVRRISRLRGRRSAPAAMRVTAITYRNDPVLRGTIEGSLPIAFLREHDQQLDHALRHCLERARPGGVFRGSLTSGTAGACHDEPDHPVEADLPQSGQAGRQRDLGAAPPRRVRYEHLIVVDDDMDVHDYAAVDWAIAYRAIYRRDDVVIMPSTLARPSTPPRASATATSRSSAPAMEPGC